jgi:hypothetical protein
MRFSRTVNASLDAWVGAAPSSTPADQADQADQGPDEHEQMLTLTRQPSSSDKITRLGQQSAW